MYVTFQKIAKALPPYHVCPLAGIFAQVAIHQDQTADRGAHIDANDIPFGYNVVAAWGEFTLSKLLLWECQQAIEIKHGDAVFFLGQVFTHSEADISGGKGRHRDWPTQLPLLQGAR